METKMQEQIMGIMQTIDETMRFVPTIDSAEIKPVLEESKEALKVINTICQQEMTGDTAEYISKITEVMLAVLDEAADLAMNGEDITAHCQAISQSLVNIADRLKAESEIKQKNKKTVVFLPYKASMWDSLESIWLAAKDDPQCEAIVMPIAYCDRNPDGTAAKWHYEGDLFPKNVPITDYHQYSLAEHHPDIIYIHNPYDGYNKVTSVDPVYYSSELNKYTDMLIYVPYFVTDGMSVGEHFCQTAGVVNADRVIVENETIKQQYIKYYLDKNATAEYLDKKFLPLGSPKIDKVKRSKREDFTLPAEWAKKLNGKKAVLYNTHLTPIMTNPQEFINKLLYVFETFKNRDDVVLWWRPHPLAEATVKSMQPGAWNAYTKIEKMYKEQNIGIFDDTADLHRAICWTDAYYGDGSSVVWLYRATGKPIMIQDLNVKSEKGYVFENGTDNFRAVAIIGEKAWLVGWSKTLIALNLNTGEIENVYFIPGNDNAYMQIQHINSKLYIVPPYSRNELIEFDVNTENFKIIKLDIYNKNANLYDDKYGYLNVVNDGRKLFLLPYGSETIVEYDTITRHCKYHTEWFRTIKTHLNDKYCGIFNGNACINDGTIYIPFLHENAIFSFETATGKSGLNYIGNKKERFTGIEFDGENYIVFLKGEKSFLKWNQNLIERVDVDADGFKYDSKGIVFSKAIINDKKMYILHANANKCFITDIGTYKLCELKSFEKRMKTDLLNKILIFGELFNEGKMLIFETNSKTMYIYDIGKDELNILEVFVSDKPIYHNMYNLMNNGEILYEISNMGRLSGLLENIK